MCTDYITYCSPGRALVCFCNQDPYPFDDNDCQLTGNRCYASITCVVQYARYEDTIVMAHTCFNVSLSLSEAYCNRHDEVVSRACCSDADQCNRDLEPPPLLGVTSVTSVTSYVNSSNEGTVPLLAQNMRYFRMIMQSMGWCM